MEYCFPAYNRKHTRTILKYNKQLHNKALIPSTSITNTCELLLDLPNELLTLIAQISQDDTRYKMVQINSLFSDIIHNNVGYVKSIISDPLHVDMVSQHKGVMRYTMIVYNLKRQEKHLLKLSGVKHIDLSGVSKRVNHRYIECLAGVHTINLYRLYIQDSTLEALAGVHNINIANCRQITGKGVRSLAGVHTVNLESIRLEDPRDFQSLSGAHSIRFTRTNIRDEDLKVFAGVHEISLHMCSQITDMGVKHLSGVHTIYLGGTSITDEGIKALAGVDTIYIFSMVHEAKITDDAIIALAGVHTILLSNLPFVTDKGIAALAGVHTISLEDMSRVTNVGIDALKGATFIEVV